MANDRKRSAVWMYFTQLSGQFKAKCNTCGNVYSFTGGSTSNLALHIRKKHPSLPSRNSKGHGGRNACMEIFDIYFPWLRAVCAL